MFSVSQYFHGRAAASLSGPHGQCLFLSSSVPFLPLFSFPTLASHPFSHFSVSLLHTFFVTVTLTVLCLYPQVFHQLFSLRFHLSLLCVLPLSALASGSHSLTHSGSFMWGRGVRVGQCTVTLVGSSVWNWSETGNNLAGRIQACSAIPGVWTTNAAIHTRFQPFKRKDGVFYFDFAIVTSAA